MNEKVYQTSFQAPKGLRIYAIGDIHGHLDLLNKMHEAISIDLLREPPEKAHIVYLGDFVDRGPDSKGVLDCLIERRDRGDGVSKSFILGNHDQGMLWFIEDSEKAEETDWLDWGGVQTLESYGIVYEEGVLLPAEKVEASKRLISIMPKEHVEFLKSLEWAVEIGEFFFAHAGVDPTKPVHKQDIRDLYFIREPFLSWPEKLSHMIVHGHTRTKGEPEILTHRVNVDTGAYETGILTAAVIEDNEVQFLKVS